MSENNIFYDGVKLLSLMDIDGGKPEIYISTSNRSAGKTTYFNRLMVNRFIRNGSKFMLVYRYDYELDNVKEKFFGDIGDLFFRDCEFDTKRRANGKFHELYLNEQPCGYAVALNNADAVKKMSHMFDDTENILFDEFQSEYNKYCSDELTKFKSIHTSVARGHGKQVRYVPVYLVANCVSLLNPYYSSLGISNRLKEDTKYLRGTGWVLEQSFNEHASESQQQSAFNRAFGLDDSYMAFASQNVYLNDNKAFIEKPTGNGIYIATIRYHGNDFGVKEYTDKGVIFVSSKGDSNFPVKISVTTDDHNINYVMLKRNDFMISNFRYLFDHGAFRFANLGAKEAMLSALSYY